MRDYSRFLMLWALSNAFIILTIAIVAMFSTRQKHYGVILLLFAATLTAIPLTLSIPSTRAAATRHFDIYQNNSTGGAGCSGQFNCFNTTFPGPAITVNQGDTVEITVHNNDSITHTFTLVSSPYSVDVTVPARTTMAVTPFTANTAGQWTYECTIHPNDMTGTFKVTQVSSAPITPLAAIGMILTVTSATYLLGRRRR